MDVIANRMLAFMSGREIRPTWVTARMGEAWDRYLDSKIIRMEAQHDKFQRVIAQA